MADIASKTAGDDKAEHKFQIYRFKDCTENDSVLMDFNETMANASESTRQAFADMAAAGGIGGAETRCLFHGAGMSILYIWFKSGFPLVRHSHNVDCLYHITAGSLKLGTEELGPGDGFFVPANDPYTYSVGPEGMEMLEFRASEGGCDMKIMNANASYWTRRVEMIKENKENWRTEKRPSGIEAPFLAHDDVTF